MPDGGQRTARPTFGFCALLGGNLPEIGASGLEVENGHGVIPPYGRPPLPVPGSQIHSN
jgi:hypothetical protein